MTNSSAIATPSETFARLDPSKRDAVLDAAVTEFAAHGYAGASISRLTRTLGIAKGSVFQYFGSKQGLFGFVFDHAAGLFADRLRQVRDTTRDADVFERVRATLQAGAEFVDAHPRLYRLYLKVLFQEGWPLREALLVQARHTSARYLRGLVDTGRERGELGSDLDPDFAVHLLDATLDRFLQTYALPYMDTGLHLHAAGPDALAQRMDQLVDALKRSLGPDNPEGSQCST